MSRLLDIRGVLFGSRTFPLYLVVLLPQRSQCPVLIPPCEVMMCTQSVFDDLPWRRAHLCRLVADCPPQSLVRPNRPLVALGRPCLHWYSSPTPVLPGPRWNLQGRGLRESSPTMFQRRHGSGRAIRSGRGRPVALPKVGPRRRKRLLSAGGGLGPETLVRSLGSTPKL